MQFHKFVIIQTMCKVKKLLMVEKKVVEGEVTPEETIMYTFIKTPSTAATQIQDSSLEW